MKIKLKDLELRVYDGKECKGFTYFLNTGERTKQRFDFELVEDEASQYPGLEWRMLTLIPRNGIHDTQVYGQHFVAPRKGIPLETIAAMGLKYFQHHIEEEIQLKSNLDFSLGVILEESSLQ